MEKYPQHLKIPPTNFIDPVIYGFLDKSNGFYQQFNLNVNDREFTVHFYLPSENSNTKDANVMDFFQDCINKIYLWLHFIVPYINGHCSKKSTFYIMKCSQYFIT